MFAYCVLSPQRRLSLADFSRSGFHRGFCIPQPPPAVSLARSNADCPPANPLACASPGISWHLLQRAPVADVSPQGKGPPMHETQVQVGIRRNSGRRTECNPQEPPRYWRFSGRMVASAMLLSVSAGIGDFCFSPGSPCPRQDLPSRLNAAAKQVLTHAIPVPPCHFLPALQQMSAIHQHLRLDDGYDSGFLGYAA